MKMAIVVPFLDGFIIVNSDGSPMKRSSRVYGDHSEAQRAADRINRARARYDRLGDTVLEYDNIYNGFVNASDLPKGSPTGYEFNTTGNQKGRGFQDIFMDNNYEDVTLRDIRDNYGSNPDVMSFLKSAVVSYPDATVRKAISQYFFISSLTEE